MFFNNKFSKPMSIRIIAPLAVLVSISLVSCATTSNTQADNSSNSDTFASMVGTQMCVPDDFRITMSKEMIGPYTAFYPQKFIGGTLTAAQLICDLGQPNETSSESLSGQKHQLPMEEGDQFYRWGDNHTNDPIDERSLMVIVNPAGDVSSIVVYDTKKKTIKRVAKVGDKLKVSTGTYTSIRSISYQ